MSEFNLASTKAGAAKKYNLKDLIASGAIVVDPASPAFQARNLQPLNPTFVDGLRKSGGWDPTKPGTLTVFEGKRIVVDANNRVRGFDSIGVEEGYFLEIRLANENDPMELHRLRLHSNNAYESDAWTEAETFAHGEKAGLTPEEQAIGCSASKVKQSLRIFHFINNIGPKAKPEEKPEATAERMNKCKTLREKTIGDIRSGKISKSDILKLMEKDLQGEDFDKALKSLIAARAKAKVEAKAEAVEKTLEEYVDSRIPSKFFPDVIVTIAKSEGLTDGQKAACTGLMAMLMGTLPRAKFVAGDFTVVPKEPKKGKGKKGAEGSAGADDAEEADEETDEE